MFNSCLGNGFGFESEQGFDWFTPAYGSILVELRAGEEVPEGAALVGYVSSEPVFRCGALNVSMASLQNDWEAPLQKVFPAYVEQKGECSVMPLVYGTRQGGPPYQGGEAPRGHPRFPGHQLRV